ncbi:MAG: hypothetical protein AB1481_06075 [Candidatus Omnitrophota bacterium]
MNKKSQILMIFLWILAILGVLAVTTGHRVSMGLRLSRYQRDSVKARYLAKAGVNRAIIEIKNDEQAMDALSDKWADNPEGFEQIFLSENTGEYATVGYVSTQGEQPAMVFGVIDEERKININTANPNLLNQLLEYYNIEDSQGLVTSIQVWRGELGDADGIYESAGYPPKAGTFSNIEEMVMVVGLSLEDFLKIKDLITVHTTEAKINVNTAPRDTLFILNRAIAKDLNIENFQQAADSLASKIIEARNSAAFTSPDDLGITPTGADETNIYNQLKTRITVTSDNFLIEVTGNASRIRHKIFAVYNRQEDRVSYIHET